MIRCVMKFIKLFGGLLFSLYGVAQPIHMPLENAYITAGAYSKHFMDAFSFTSNPACLAGIRTTLSGILTERKWMLKELDSYQIAVSCNLGKAGIGIALQQSGDADYNEQSMELAYGKHLGHLEIGIRFCYLRDQAAGYPGAGFGSSGIAIRFHVTEKLITGWELGLPVFGEAGKMNPEKGPQFFRMGFGYELRTDLFLAFQILKASGSPLHIVSSLEYRFGGNFFFSVGINSYADSPWFKSGWKKNRLCIQLYTSYEPVLGLSPGLVLLWEAKNKKQ